MRVSENAAWDIWDREYKHERPTHGLVGLANQGATCYLNSLLQALFMLAPFRDAVYAGDDGTGGDAEMTEEDVEAAVHATAQGIPGQLRLLFARLHHSVQRSAQTTALTQSFGWGSDEAFQQHDVLELFSILLEALSLSVVGSDAPDPARLFDFQVSDLLEYDLPDGVVVRRSRTVTEKNLSLPLDESTGSLETALSRYVATEEIEGYMAEEADGARVVARKCMRFASLPRCLLFNLGRFTFDWERQRRVKLDHPCAFPVSMDMQAFVDPAFADQAGCTTYQLSAVLVHSGTAYSGHYLAYVRDSATGRWYEFNDEKVTLAAAPDESESPQNFAAAFLSKAFGGDRGGSRRPGSSSSLSAYGLIYSQVEVARDDASPTRPRYPSLPPLLARMVEQENRRWEANRDKFLKQRNSVTFDIRLPPEALASSAGDPPAPKPLTVVTDKSATVDAVINSLREAMAGGPASMPDDNAQCRLRPCHPKTGVATAPPLGFLYNKASAQPVAGGADSCAVDRSEMANMPASAPPPGQTSSQPTLEELGLWQRTHQCVLLEVMDGSGAFPAVPAEQVKVQAVEFLGDSGTFSAPVTTCVSLNPSGFEVADVALSVSEQLEQLAPGTSDSTRSTAGAAATLMVVDLTNEPPTLRDGFAVKHALTEEVRRLRSTTVTEPLTLYVHRDRWGGDSPSGVAAMKEAFSRLANMIYLPANVRAAGANPASGHAAVAAAEHVVELSKLDTVGQLKQRLAAVTDIPPADMVLRSASTARELKHLGMLLDNPEIDVSLGVLVSRGVPLRATQTRLQVVQPVATSPFPGSGPTALADLGPFVVDETTLVREITEAFADQTANAGAGAGAGAGGATQESHVRARLVRADGRLGRLLSSSSLVTEAMGSDLMDGCRLCLERSSAASQVPAGAVLVDTFRWNPATSTLSEPKELFVLPSWTLEHLVAALPAAMGGSAVVEDPSGSHTDNDTVQVIRPWGYQLRDPSSLHLLNWKERGFSRAAEPEQPEPSPGGGSDSAARARSPWTLLDGDVLVWRTAARPSGDGNATSGVPLAVEKPLHIHVSSPAH